VAKVAESDYLLRIDSRVASRDPFIRVPGVGPVLTFRLLGVAPEELRHKFSLNMGDVELF
jgi:hypothetical protein